MAIVKDLYNTPIPDEKRHDFLEWIQEESKRQNRNILMDIGDYDIQGYWLSGDWKNTDKRGHGSDKWKKPNHPTFSTESIYHGKDDYKGGRWLTENGKTSFAPSNTNLNLFGEQRLYEYFRQFEPNVRLLN